MGWEKVHFRQVLHSREHLEKFQKNFSKKIKIKKNSKNLIKKIVLKTQKLIS